ncbi:hypothetical protein [Nocardioides sp.]|uniref:hypothetical protein n=1 Tax=Nocardioides sp. TaxID=35761 RepID=UPI00260E1755|nr:hypothetical protein [Nocardioides sp.]
MSRAAPRRRAEKPRRVRRGRDRAPVAPASPAVGPVVRRVSDEPAPAPAADIPAADPDSPDSPDPGSSPGSPDSADRPSPRATAWRERLTRLRRSRVPQVAWWLTVLTGTALLVCGVVPVGPSWLGGAGSVAVVTAYTWALAARTGGRPVVFGGLALAVGVLVLLLDDDRARTGAAVMTCAVSAVLAVMTTVPAKRFREAARECTIAVAVASVGALATVGFAPALTVVRFQYVTLGLALVGAFLLVHRLGAGFHGLGRRGLLATVGGGAVLLAFVGYAELLRTYGPGDLVATLLDGVRWCRENLGAFPRPLETVLGVPALAWGCHMRARRRQGWWVCAFGAAGTASVANALTDPSVALLESGLSVLYGLVLGLVLGYAVIRVDLRLTGSRGRRARRDEQDSAERPEPARSRALL